MTLLRRLWHWLSLWFVCQAEHKFNPMVIIGKDGLLVTYRCRFCSLGGTVGPLTERDVPWVVQALTEGYAWGQGRTVDDPWHLTTLVG